MDDNDYVFPEQLGTGLLSTNDGWKELADWQGYARELPTLEDELHGLPRPCAPEKTIYVIHMPPAGVGFDKCAHGAEVGSLAVYRFIETRQPLLSLHGHIHESPEITGIWKTQIGRTYCAQPGQSEDLVYVAIDLSTTQLERCTVDVSGNPHQYSETSHDC